MWKNKANYLINLFFILYSLQPYSIMEKEKKLFKLRLESEDKNVGDYNIDDFEKYLLNHAGRRNFRDCDRRYIYYLKNFIIPDEAIRGEYKGQRRSQFRDNLAKQLVNFSKTKKEAQTNSQPALQNQVR